MKRPKQRSIAVLALMAWVTTLAAGCYYDRDERWGYHRYPERRYSYRYYHNDRYSDWRYDRDHPTVKGGGRVPAIVISSRTPPGTTSDLLYHHQSVLRLALKALGIEHAPGLASIAPDMSDFFPKPGEQPLGVGEKPAAHPEGPPH